MPGPYRFFTLLFLIPGFGILILSYAVICLHTGSWWPWTHVVHEDGIRTLLATVLYFEHGARELPLDLVLGLAIGGGLLFAFPPGNVHGSRITRRSEGIPGTALVAGISVAIIVLGATLDVGLTGLRENLLQYHTRPLAPLEWGSHWRYHLLSRLALVLVAIGIAGFLRFFMSGEADRPARQGLRIFGFALAAYGILTALFWNGFSTFLLPFLDPVYLGHQAREFFTHILATLPIAWGICTAVVSPMVALSPNRDARLFAWPVTVTAGLLGIILGLYVCVGALLKDSASQGQTDNLAMLLFPHFFEHVQTYFVVTAVALLVYRVNSRKGTSSR